ncbi:M16 family metallopeptidase [Rhizosphaericola mali]|uniref:Insulinase family protein n=1 Tax=Rhizosphaericola mali TaxID=2545455 RepID=A0A5P2FUW7_9BACT|nr:pitrilysin family protein [Rhizosphaericola mali]QES87254.1 insulinase family protein [Rhizosphaericola mali]
MKMFTLTLGLLLFGMGAYAQSRLPKGYFWDSLPNGLQVVVIENSKVPLATIEIAVKNGAYTEGPEYSGLSHLFEHMFFKANNDYPNQEKFLKRTQELGAIWNGTTGEERVNYFFTIPKDSLDAGLHFMNSAIRFPIYRPEDMAKERPVVDGEFQRAESSPDFQLWYAVSKNMWGDLMTRKNPIGDHNIINTATPEKMMIIKNKYYVPNNSLLVVCGDVQHQSVMTEIEQIFGNWKRSAVNPQIQYPIPEFKPLDHTDYFVKESSIAQTPFIMMEWQGPDTRKDSAATLAADVFSTILGLNSSKFQQSLVNTGLATYAGIGYQTAKYVGPISIYLMPNPKNLKECIDSLETQISMMGDENYFTDEQLNDAKEKLKRQQIREREKPSALASQLTFWWCSASLDYFSDYFSNLEKISKADVLAYAKKYIVNKPHVAGMIINPEMNKALHPASFFKPIQ